MYKDLFANPLLPILIEELSGNGYHISDIAKRLSISDEDLEQLLKQSDDLQDSFINGIGKALSELELSLYKRALGYDYSEFKTKFYKGNEELIYEKKHQPADTVAIIACLIKYNKEMEEFDQ